MLSASLYFGPRNRLSARLVADIGTSWKRLLGVGFDFGGARIAHEKMLTTSSHTHGDGASSTYLTHSLT
jgi:hypothetical protein